jgi:hypothetical protein
MVKVDANLTNCAGEELETGAGAEHCRQFPSRRQKMHMTERSGPGLVLELGGKLPRTVDNVATSCQPSSSVVKITTKNVCRVTKQLETKYYTLVEVGRVLSSDSILVCVAGESHL